MKVSLKVDEWKSIEVNSVRSFAESIYVMAAGRAQRSTFTLRRLACQTGNTLPEVEEQLRNWARTKTRVAINIAHGFCASVYLGRVEEIEDGDFRVADNDGSGFFHFIPRLSSRFEVVQSEGRARVLMMDANAGCSLEIIEYRDEPATTPYRWPVIPGAWVH